MNELFNRFLCALVNDTSTVVQAISAITSAIATVVLVRVTGRYVRLTNDLAKSAAAQLSAMVQPRLSLTLGNGYPLGFGQMQVLVRNIGDNLVKVKRILILWRDTTEILHVHPIPIVSDRVLLPERENSDRIDEVVQLSDLELQSVRNPQGTDEYSVAFDLVVDCSDIGDATKHSYILSQQSGLLHQSAFYADDRPQLSLIGRIRAALRLPQRGQSE